MSRYSEKKGTAQCKEPNCTEPGTKLEVRDGKLDWYCQGHAATDR